MNRPLKAQKTQTKKPGEGQAREARHPWWQLARRMSAFLPAMIDEAIGAVNWPEGCGVFAFT
jgi:hypothetical protein